MKKNLTGITIVAVVLTLFISITACDNLLEGSPIEVASPHVVAPFVRPPVERIVVWGYDELEETILGFIMDFSPGGVIQYHHDEGEDVQANVLQIVHDIMNYHPIGAYIVADIEIDATILLTYFEINVEIDYRRTQEQLNSIVTVSTRRYLMTQLRNSMSRHDEELLIRTGLNLTEEDIVEMVREIYYANPGRVVMLPFVAVDFYPEVGYDRVYEIKFGYTESTSMLQTYGANLTMRIYDIVERVSGGTDSDILLAIAEFLIAAAEFDIDLARTMSVHGTQNLATTAFGALERGSAVGEGFALAFKALTDELGFDNRIVLGHFDGMVHAWNIVYLYGDFYHFDIAMSSIYGLERAFLRTDEDFEYMNYVWDRATTVRSEGLLTLGDILHPYDPYYENEDDGQNREDNDNG